MLLTTRLSCQTSGYVIENAVKTRWGRLWGPNLQSMTVSLLHLYHHMDVMQ